MDLKHKVSICVARPDGGRTAVLKGGSRTLRSKLLGMLFGDKVGVIVVTPGETVETVEIKELRGGERNGQDK